MPTILNAVPVSFDGLARQYDSAFTHAPVAQLLRARIWQRLDALFLPGMRVLEIGCGTGEDALHLIQRGVEVVATDVSREMLATAEQKISSAGYTAKFQLFDLNTPETWTSDGQFDGVYSNFGPLNCTRNWKSLADYLSEITAPGSYLAFGVMGRFCLWETLWHGLHGDWRTATRRWSGENIAVLEDGSLLPVFYPSTGQLTGAFSPAFSPVKKIGLGVFLPPGDVYRVLEKRPKLLHLLNSIEKHFAPHYLADHYWLELQKT